MATLTIKNIPDDLYEKLKQAAKENRRSINNEIIVIIERAFQDSRPDVEQILEEARQIRESISYYITDEELEQWINEGRP